MAATKATHAAAGWAIGGVLLLLAGGRVAAAAAAGDSFDLRTDGRLTPANPSLRLHGMFSMGPEAPRFVECLTGRSYAVSQEGEYAKLAAEYLARSASAPGVPILASFDGVIRGPSRADDATSGQTVGIRRLTGLWPSQACERAMSHASLANQYWRVDRLRGVTIAPLAAAPGDVYVIVRAGRGGYVADAGCGRVGGGYRVDGTSIAFDPPVPTPPHDCPVELHERQQALLGILGAARRWVIQGQVLELFDAAGASLAALEAVYLH